MTTAILEVRDTLVGCLKELHLPAFRSGYEELARQAQQEASSYEQYLLGLARRECQERRQRRIERLLRASRLPLEKSWPALDLKRLPAKVVQQARTLLEGSFVDRRENVLAFGVPGSGKTHLLCAIAQELVRNLVQSHDVGDRCGPTVDLDRLDGGTAEDRHGHRDHVGVRRHLFIRKYTSFSPGHGVIPRRRTFSGVYYD